MNAALVVKSAIHVVTRQQSRANFARNMSAVTQSNYVSPFASFFRAVKEGKTSSGLSETEPLVRQSKLLKCGIAEDALSFKATHYTQSPLPPFVQRGEFKVTLKISLDDIPFENEVERDMLLQLVGNRYHEKTNRLMLTSDKFPSRIENKRYLVELLDRLVIGAKKLAVEGDSYFDSISSGSKA